MLPNAAEWDKFYAALKGRTGLDLHLYKPGQMQRRIISMCESKSCKNLEDFWKVISTEKDGINWFLDKMAINVSELFRNPEKWVELEQKILPELLSKAPRLKIWSAGCSIGAEAHSVATILADKFPGSHTIVGTDIDQAALAQARSGVYSEMETKCVPAPYKAKYYDRDGTNFVAKPELKKYLNFKTGNLLEDNFDSGFDLIICRNVVIYFTDEAKDALYRRFFNSLKPGGILFVGSTERIFNYRDMGYEAPITFFYQKPVNGETQRIWRSAS